MILNSEEKVKELYNLLNSFEICYPIIKNKIKKYEISNLKDKCYLAWFAGQLFFNQETNFSKDIFMDYFFNKIFDTFKLKNIDERSVLFAFFSLGGIVSLNNFEEVKTILNDYYKIIASGIILIQRLKFDIIEDGIKKWRIETIKKIGNFSKDEDTNDTNTIKEFNKIISSKFDKKNDIKILN